MIPPRRLLGMLLLAALAIAGYADARLRRDFVDFEVYHTAGQRVRRAEPLYRDDDGHFQYKYLPAFAIAMVPFTYGDIEVAKPVWFALSVGLLVWFFQQAVLLLPNRRLRPLVLYCFLVPLASKFIVKELVNGQSNVMLGVLVMAALAAALKKQPRLAGLSVAAAVFVKPYALIMLPWMLVSLDIDATLSFAGAMGLGLLLPVPIYGWSGNLALLQGWFHTVSSTTAPNLLMRDAVSLAAMWAKWLGPGSTASLLALVSSVLVLCAAVPVWWRRRAVPAPAFLEVALLLLMVPLLSPQGWDYVLILGIPAIACLIDRWRDVTIPWRAIATVAIVLTCLLTYDTLGQKLYMKVTTFSIVSLGALLAIVSLTHVRVKSLA